MIPACPSPVLLLASEIKNSLYYTQVGRRGANSVSLMKNEGVAQYLMQMGIIPPSSQKKKGRFNMGSIFNMLLGAQPVASCSFQ